MLRRIVKLVIDYLKQFNIYVSTNEDNIEERQDQITATRIFLVLFLVSLIGLVGYTSLSLQLTTVQIDNPSQSDFEELYSIYPDTLVCPCSQTSIQVDKFVNVTVSYHQICSSIFVSDEWISSISYSIPTSFYLLDIRRMISSQMQIIASQCRLSQVLITDALNSLAANQLFIPTMLSQDSLNSQIDILVGEAINNTIAAQFQNLYYLLGINEQNQFGSALSNTFLYVYINDTNQFYIVQFLDDWTYPPPIDVVDYSSSQLCSCLHTRSCFYPSGIYPNLPGSASYIYQGVMIPPIISLTQISGSYVGCMAFDSILISTLECFYHKDCLSQLINMTNIEPLNNSIDSIFPPVNTTFTTLVNQLFIENWSSKIDFGLFFKECQPNKCTYSYNSRGNVAFIITTILSLIGGLFVGIRIIALLIVTIYRMLEKKYKKKSSHISPISTIHNKDKSTSSNRHVPYKLFVTIREQIRNLNLFKKEYNDAHGRRNELLTTRFYILLMFIGLIVIIFYASLVEHTLTYTIDKPSLDTYRKLVAEYPSLTCPCEKITANYSVFFTISPIQHQVCSSIFVKEAFIQSYQDNGSAIPLGQFNLQLALPTYESSGNHICNLMNYTIFQLVDTFLQTIYASSDLTDENEFNSRMNATLNNFEALAPAPFVQLLQLTRRTTQGNQLLIGTFSNAVFQYNISATTEENAINILWINPSDESCNCGLSANSCSISYDDYCAAHNPGNDTCPNPLPGLILSCYPIDGLMISTLQCLYEVDCVEDIFGPILLNSPLHINPSSLSVFVLNASASSRYYPNSTVFDILSTLGIEDWNANINYSLYYNNCNPINCIYTITKKFNIPTVITTVVGLIGGLSVILRIVLPPPIKFFRRRRQAQIDNTRIPQRGFQFHRSIKKIRHLNFFETAETAIHPEIRHDQIISTRLYLSLWIISVTVLTIYTGLSQKKSNIVVNSPSITDVNQLQLNNYNDFSCPCSKISIPFETFTSQNYIFHQICLSDFISYEWLAGLFNFGNEHSVGQAVLASHFQLINFLCQSSNETLIDATDNFNANQFISVNILTENEFNDQITALVEAFQNQTFNSFQNNLALVIDITLGNQYISIYETNWHFIPDPNNISLIYTQARSYQSGNCSCSTSQASNCSDPLIINGNTSISGMFIGCLPITSLLLSSLQCFYDDICLNDVKKALNLQNLSIISLNSTQLRQFSMNTSLNKIINNLMLEEWIYNINHSEYFNQCNPQQCTYSIIERNNVLVIFTTLLGFYGGLTIILGFITPTIVAIGRKIHNKCRFKHRTVPEPF